LTTRRREARMAVLVLPPGLCAGEEAMNLADVVVRIVHSADLIGHEVVDGRRVERLVQRLRSDGTLKNPPAVVEVGSKYVVLDGASRVAALRELGVRDVVVQIVNYEPPGVELHSWCHVVVGMACQDLVDGLKGVQGIEVKSMEMCTARAGLSQESVLCYVVLRDGGVLAAVVGSSELEARVNLLNDIVGLYGGCADVYRAANEIVWRSCWRSTQSLLRWWCFRAFVRQTSCVRRSMGPGGPWE
jgi:hypothetical protein